MTESDTRGFNTHAEADTVINMTGNLLCRQPGGETTYWVSERFLPALQYMTTVNVSSVDTPVSKSEYSSAVVSPATIATLSAGEFVGIVSDEPGKERPLKAFHAKEVKEGFKVEMPVVREVSQAEVEECFKRVKREVVVLVEKDMRRIGGDPVRGG